MRLADFYVREHVHQRPAVFARFFDGLCRVAGLISGVIMLALVLVSFVIPPEYVGSSISYTAMLGERVSYVPVAASYDLRGSLAWLRRDVPPPPGRILHLASLRVHLVAKGSARAWLWWR